MEDIHSNEDATSKDWITLNDSIQFLDDGEVFTEKESGHAFGSLKKPEVRARVNAVQQRVSSTSAGQ